MSLGLKIARNPWAWAVAAALGLALYQTAGKRAAIASHRIAEARADAAIKDAAEADSARLTLAASVERWKAEAQAAENRLRIARIEAVGKVEAARRRYLDAVQRDPLPVGDCPAILDWLSRQHSATIERHR